MRIYSGPMRAAALVICSIALAGSAAAVDTHVWQQDDPSEFTRGTIKNLSVRSDGRLTVAPVFKELADLATPYLWAVVEDSKGTLYCAGGSGALLFAPPLAPGGTLRKAQSAASCDLLVQLIYNGLGND